MLKKVLVSSLFFISIISIINIYQFINYRIHINRIDNIFSNDVINNEYNYIGYIEINRINIKREIVQGINNNNLRQHVCLKGSSLDNGNIILAGHSIKSIFGNLHNISLNDKIKITTFEKDYYFQVISINVVSKYNVNIIDDSNLILITCMSNNNKRLIVKAKRI